MMNRFFTLLLAASCLTAVGQDTTMVCGYGITSQGGGIGSWPYADIFIPSNQKAVTIYADFYRPQYSGSALDFSAAYCAGCSESDLLDWSPPYPNYFLWNYDTIPFPMYGTELFFDDISNSEVIGPGYLRTLAPLTQVNDEWNDLCIGFLELSGCVDDQACNYSEEILISNPESCDYSCCPGPGCCGEGMLWDWNIGECAITNPADINLDGCVQLNDLLDLLSAYGDCGAEESPWLCGDPLEYQGYDYETVQIGEQCWFAENLRAENYLNGDSIPAGLSESDWDNTDYDLSGATAVYGEGSSAVNTGNDDAFSNLSMHGRLYNFFAVSDERSICPVGWLVPSTTDFEILLTEVGNTDALKGLESSSGFDSTFGGRRTGLGSFYYESVQAAYWTQIENIDNPGDAFNYILGQNESTHYPNSSQGVWDSTSMKVGFSVRCIKD